MASVETLRPPADIRLAGQAEPRVRSLETQVVDAPARRSSRDEDGGVVALAAGSAILLFQACAIIPGLLPCLLIALLLALPLVLPVVALGVLVGVPIGIWRLVALAWRRTGGRSA